jgi:hypothetical protein
MHIVCAAVKRQTEDEPPRPASAFNDSGGRRAPRLVSRHAVYRMFVEDCMKVASSADGCPSGARWKGA